DLESFLQRVAIPDSFPPEFAPELAEAVRETVAEAMQERPIAGPEDAFVHGIFRAIEVLLERHELTIEDDVEELIRLYGKPDAGPTTESRLLPLADRMRLRARISQYNELRNHPLHSYQEPPAALELAFLMEGWGHATHSLLGEDASPADVMRAFHRAR